MLMMSIIRFTVESQNHVKSVDIKACESISINSDVLLKLNIKHYIYNIFPETRIQNEYD